MPITPTTPTHRTSATATKMSPCRTPSLTTMLQHFGFTIIVAYLAISRSILVYAFLVARFSKTTDGNRNMPIDMVHSHEVVASTSTALFLTPERYEYHDHKGGDEELFLSLAKEKSRRDTGIVTVRSDVDAPTPELKPEDVAPLLMNALKNNNIPKKDSGLMLVWEFASDTTKYIFKNNITEFIESCHETADEFPTSFYGAAMYGHSWDMETELNRVGGEEGWIATQVMKTISSDGRLRRWQWELRKNKSPPCLGCWKVESIGSSDRNGDFEARDRGDGWSD